MGAPDEREHEPNEYGFGGAATVPDAEPDEARSFAERTAIPGDDLTQGLVESITDPDADTEDERAGGPA